MEGKSYLLFERQGLEMLNFEIAVFKNCYDFGLIYDSSAAGSGSTDVNAIFVPL
jgi:hypothetical protein